MKRAGRVPALFFNTKNKAMIARTIQPVSTSVLSTATIQNGNVVQQTNSEPVIFDIQQGVMTKPLVLVDENGNVYDAQITSENGQTKPELELVYVAPKAVSENESFISKIPVWAWIGLALLAIYAASQMGIFKTAR